MATSTNQLQDYERDGFLVLRDFVPTTTCDELRQRAEQLVQEFDPTGVISIFTTHEQSRVTDDYFLESADKIRFFFEEDAFFPNGTLKQSKEQSINKIGHALHTLDPLFRAFSHSSAIRELVADLAIADPRLVQSMYIFKQPKIGGEVGCHQDSTFLYTEPTNIAGLWLALEDATINNGCLWAIPGGHILGLKSRWVRAPEGGMRFHVFDSELWPEEQLQPLEVAKGTLILLHGLLPHKSLANRSTKSRHAYTLHVISGKSHYASENWLQPRSESEGFARL
jgi:phytanoyl-CoA hydroxylase